MSVWNWTLMLLTCLSPLARYYHPWYTGSLLTDAYQRRFCPLLSGLVWIINNVQFCGVRYVVFQFVTKEWTTYCASLDGPNDEHVITHMQYTHTHPRVVLTQSTAPIHTYVESSCSHLHSHSPVLNIICCPTCTLSLSHAHTVYVV